jgi:hypothetical protein
MMNSIFKSLVLMISAFLITTSLALADPLTTPPPNHYDLQGGSLHIVYSTTGIDGKPHFSYKNGTQTLSFSGDQIRTVGTEIGTLVSVTTFMTIDSGSTSFSVLIPRVNLDSTLRAAIKTEGIRTKHKFSIIPNLNRGQLDTYKYTVLTGSARFVTF